MKELNFTILGLRGVGKTTLLTSMYEQTVDCLKGTGVSFHADLATSTAMKKYRDQLQRLADETKVMVKYGGIAGTGDLKEYIFELSRDSKPADMKVRFTDFPGGWLLDERKSQNVVQLCADSHVILIPIDAPPLMELKGRFHNQINDPSHIRSILNEVRKHDGDRSRLIIFAPIRCEKYVNERESIKNLVKRVHDEYEAIINELKSDSHAIVITPVQTVGCLRFSSFGKQEEGVEELQINFRKARAGAKYSPKDCDQPMRYLLRFLLRASDQETKKKWFHWLTFGLFTDSSIREAIETIADGCKDGADGFQIVHGHDRL
jgi:hypothetical protein